MPPAKERGPRGLAKRQGPFENAPGSCARLPDSLEATPRARARRQRTELRCRTTAGGMSPTHPAPGCTGSTRDPRVEENTVGDPAPCGHGERSNAWTYCPARVHPAHEAWLEPVTPRPLRCTGHPVHECENQASPMAPAGSAAAGNPVVCPPPTRHQAGDRQHEIHAMPYCSTCSPVIEPLAMGEPGLLIPIADAGANEPKKGGSAQLTRG